MAEPRKQASNPGEVAPPLKGHYSNSVRVTAGPLLFIAGQIATDAEGKIVGVGDLRAQADRCSKTSVPSCAPTAPICRTW